MGLAGLTQVDDLHLPRDVDQDVRRLQVAVDETSLCHGNERLGDLNKAVHDGG
jgi:hypothetical protein